MNVGGPEPSCACGSVRLGLEIVESWDYWVRAEPKHAFTYRYEE